MSTNDVTLVITSSNRPDLLRRTIHSFLEFNTYPIEEYIIIDDSENKEFHEPIKKEYGKLFKIICNEKRIGQVASIDKAYSEVKTPWVFHSEDDWEYYQGRFIEKSLLIMLQDPKVLQVWLREASDTNGHPVLPDQYMINGIPCMDMSFGYLGYHGFSFNPGLKRISDYKLIGNYATVPYDPGSHPSKTARFYCPEMEISQFYYEKGFRAVILPEGSVRHTGQLARVGWD